MSLTRLDSRGQSLDATKKCITVAHSGAGHHSRRNEKKHLTLVGSVVQHAQQMLRDQCDSNIVTIQAIKELEDSPLTNAGRGSNLTLDGIPEYDATFIDFCGKLGAVSAITQVNNPIQVAVAAYQLHEAGLSCRRIGPNIVAGEGAVELAQMKNIPIVPFKEGVTKSGWIRYQEYKDVIHAEEGILTPKLLPEEIYDRHLKKMTAENNKRLEHASNLQKKYQVGSPPDTDPLEQGLLQRKSESQQIIHNQVDGSSQDDQDQDIITDTVGAISIDMNGKISAASSSGGIGLKLRGRVGPAAVPGAGTFVRPADPNDPQGITVAVVISGSGEYITSTMAAVTVAERLYFGVKKVGAALCSAHEDDILETFIREEFLEHPSVAQRGDRNQYPVIGILAVKSSKSSTYCYWGHNSSSFCFASMGRSDDSPSSIMSRVGRAGQIVIGGRRLR